jgi:hypothetical protein
MRSAREGFRRARPRGRMSTADLAEVVEGVLRTAPDRLWSADDVRERLEFGRPGGGPAASSVRVALRALERAGRIERQEVWGRRGWGNTVHAYRTRSGPSTARLWEAA